MLPNMDEITRMLQGGADNVRREAEHHVYRIVNRLEDIAKGIERLETFERHRRIAANGVSDGTSARIDIGKPARGHQWLIQRVAAEGSAITDVSVIVGDMVESAWEDITSDVFGDSVGGDPIWVPADVPVQIDVLAGAGNVKVAVQVIETRID